jgi:hypothetical protein
MYQWAGLRALLYEHANDDGEPPRLPFPNGELS